jgi:Holliday junction resolvase RusA-like endonuclease
VGAVIEILYTGKIASDNRRLAKAKSGRFYQPKEYRRSLDDLVTVFKAAAMASIENLPYKGPVGLSMEVWTLKDGSNVLKIICDALQASGIIKNDRDIKTYVVDKHKGKRGQDTLRMTVWELDYEDMAWGGGDGAR